MTKNAGIFVFDPSSTEARAVEMTAAFIADTRGISYPEACLLTLSMGTTMLQKVGMSREDVIHICGMAFDTATENNPEPESTFEVNRALSVGPEILRKAGF